MSSNLDAAGTMTIITLIYLDGLHGFWIEMRGGVVFALTGGMLLSDLGRTRPSPDDGQPATP
jgi:hypothetical protein